MSVQANTVQTSSPYRWVVLGAYWLTGLIYWASWFVQAPLLVAYWGQHMKLALPTATLLISVVGIVTIFTAVLAGRLVDTLGARRSMGIGILISLVGFGLRPLALHSFGVMLFLTIVGSGYLGFLTAGVGPLFSGWFKPEDVKMAIGFGTSSFTLGSGLGIIVSARLVASIGLPSTFWLYSAFLLVAAVVWWTLARDGERPKERPAQFLASFREVMSTGSAWRVSVFGLLLGGTTVFLNGFLPGYFMGAFKVSPEIAGSVAGLFAVAAGIGLFVIPPIAKRLARVRSVMVMVLALACLEWVMLCLGVAHSVMAATTLVMVFGFLTQSPWALGLGIQEELPGVKRNTEGVASGMYVMATNVGTILIPEVGAFSVQSFGVRGGLWAVLVLVLVGMAIMLSVRVPDMHMVRSKPAIRRLSE